MRHLEKSNSNVSQEQNNKNNNKNTTTFKLIERDARVENDTTDYTYW